MALISDKIPVFKKKVASFLSREDGKISKESLVKAGILVSIFSLGAAMSAKSASAGCNRDCPGINNSLRPDKSDYHSNTLVLHDNGASLVKRTDEGLIVGSHSHCVEDCHASHASHGSHGSHCSNGICHSW